MITYLSASADFSLYTSASFSGNWGQASQVPAISGQDIQPEQANSAGQPDTDSYECETCKNRKYQDGSRDPGVSFKTPTRLSPERAAFAIRAHEAEHVAHARVKAQKEDQEIVSQSVSYRTGVCPECGRVYMAGGTTRTTFRSAPVVEEMPIEKGQYVDLKV
ncbi:MAG: hypothetical protein HFG55_10235 [Lachnospiraceae bacterium]|nr:hypothetical protein [Lachnospiraceae bacterium]